MIGPRFWIHHDCIASLLTLQVVAVVATGSEGLRESLQSDGMDRFAPGVAERICFDPSEGKHWQHLFGALPMGVPPSSSRHR
jgi:hypothetical protein